MPPTSKAREAVCCAKQRRPERRPVQSQAQTEHAPVAPLAVHHSGQMLGRCVAHYVKARR
eukprot:scaffold7548_cov277-Pinguiococcus_pyrenoidosus.AAC.1